MSKRVKIGCYLLFYVIVSINSRANDTLFINKNKDIIDIRNYLTVLEDKKSILTIDSIIGDPQKYQFVRNPSGKLNFGFSTSTFWIKLTLSNKTEFHQYYVFEVSNPDLDYISFYQVSNNHLNKEINTGELRKTNTRDVYHRNFLFRITLEPHKNYTFYISANNGGHSFLLPINLIENRYFYESDNKTELIYWFVYGILFFIILFNVYLYYSTREKVNLYYSLYVFFATIFFFYYDGYFYFLNLPPFFEGFKWIIPSLYMVFLLSFTQTFTDYNNRFKHFRKLFTPFKIIAIFASLFYFFDYPLSLIADVGIPVMALITYIAIIAIAISTYDKKYLPSQLFLLAYLALFVGMILHELKEFNIIPSTLFMENIIKFSVTLQCLLLTMAVLERFRINQQKDKETIQQSLNRIEIQNKELEIINTELEKLAIVASETDNSVAIYDNNGRIEWCNAGFERFYESNLDVLIKTKKDNIEDIVPNSDIKKLLEKCLLDKKPITFETPFRIKLQKEKWVQTTLSPFIRSGRIQKVIAVDSDITNLKTYEQKLKTAKEKAEESDRLKTVFLGNMSHEIRTPLNGILGFSELLGRDNVPNDKKQRFVKLILSNGEQLIRIIDDIVDISLIESNQLKINLIDFSLRKFIEETIDFFEFYKTSIDKSTIDLKVDIRLADELDIITSDPVRLKQVLFNILKNSFKFTDNGYVKLGCLSIGQSIMFYSEDSGIGIDEIKKDIIFERFRQGDESSTRKYGGTGLGLSISKGIIYKMGGRIWVDSDIKIGSKICFTVPLIVPEIFLAKKKFIEDSMLLTKKIKDRNILVVEDHDISYDLLVEILSPYKPVLLRALDGLQAIEMTKSKNFDLVLMDINLPVLDGVAATKAIRKFDRQIPIIAQTAYVLDSERETILASGCNNVISKPLNSNELFELLTMHL